MNRQAPPGPTPIRLSLPHARWAPAGPAPERIIQGAPAAQLAEAFSTADERVSAGYWCCEPGRWRVVYDETEYCRIIAGQGVIHGADGWRLVLGPGDEIIVPGGFIGEWEVTETMTKTYVAILP